ncbi:heterokaryon incompatibility protein-domain-containing protein [Rhexocercosporidium sp. MPI-PUGE-AT-0058]|nr:heterokaryon incompatibility protein-domain-containing protein [Rhexocercosporidium sp. MPI-PUGE-AT-0058]
MREDLLSVGLSRISVKTLQIAKEKYDRSRNEKKIEKLKDFTYNKVTKPSGIRLLKIKDGLENDPIQCEVFEVSLDDEPSFDALSYTWKADPATPDEKEPRERPIECNGAVLKVQSNLYHALAQFRRSKRFRPLWIDRVCIDQEDSADKFTQIAMMGRIYGSAENVLVWLGKSSIIHELALKVMAKLPTSGPPASIHPETDLFTLAKDTGASLPRTFHPIQHGFTPAKRTPSIPSMDNRADQHADAVAVLRVLRRGWFTRTWTLQEFLLAKNVVMCMGSKEIDPLAVLNATKWLMEFYQTDAMTAANVRDILWEYSHLLAIPALVNSRYHFGKGVRWSLEEYTAIVRTHAVTEPKDKVYASYSLINTEIPHVTGTAAHVYGSFAKTLLHSKTDIGTLSLVGSVPSKITDLPSWVPDLSVKLRPKPLRYSESDSFGTASSSISRFDITSDVNMLSIKAAQFDVITSTGESIWVQSSSGWSEFSYEEWPNRPRFAPPVSREKMGLTLDIGTSLGKIYQPTGEPSIVVLCHTLLAGMFAGKPSPPQLIPSFIRWLCIKSSVMMKISKERESLFTRLWTANRKPSGRSDPEFKALLDDVQENMLGRVQAFIECHESPEYSLKEVWEEMANWVEKTMALSVLLSLVWRSAVRDNSVESLIMPFMYYFDDVYDGRRLFKTAKGFLGVGADSLDVGDVIMLVSGADVPYILRPVAGKEKTYLLIGEAYIHGIMQGEAMKDLEDKFEMVKLV